MQIKILEWDSVSEIGYEQQTTFFSDFGIANAFGESAIKDTYKRAFQEWKNDKIYWTEICLVLNRWCWYFANKNEDFSELYAKLYYKAYDHGVNTFKGDDLTYFLATLD